MLYAAHSLKLGFFITLTATEQDGSHYKTASLNFVVREKDKLYQALAEFGYFSSKSTASTPDPTEEAEFEEGDCSKVCRVVEKSPTKQMSP